jgi:hypothetical protein
MSTLRTDWESLRGRIEGAREQVDMIARLFGSKDASQGELHSRVIRPAFHAIDRAVQSFLDAHSLELADDGRTIIQRFQSAWSAKLQDSELANPLHSASCVIALVGLRSELDFFLADRTREVLRQTNRALSHLQRSIAVDADFRQRWAVAFGDHETACERLGAVHLLSHGIFAFKIDASGGRSDLVFNAKILDGRSIAQSADALVLTEWKRVTDPQQTRAKVDEARHQTLNYTSGILGGVELDRRRYLVMVSETNLADLPPDFEEGGIWYHCRNIAVSPEQPSVASRRASKAATK